MRLNLKKRYIFSYVLVVLAVIVLTNATLIGFSIASMRDTLESEQVERGTLALNDMENRLDTFLQIRNSIKTNYIFQPLYQKRFYTRRLDLIKSFGNYSSYLLDDTTMYLVYRNDDIIYFDNTCASWNDLCRLYWKIANEDNLRMLLYEEMETRVVRAEALQGDLLYVLPFFMGYGANLRASLCLVCRVPELAVQTRIQRSTGLKPGEYYITHLGNTLVGEASDTWREIRSDRKDFLVGLSTISDAGYQRMVRLQRTLLLLCGTLAAVSIVLAVSMAIRQYKPIGYIYEHVGGNRDGQNELIHINQVVFDMLKENERIKKDISAQIALLENQSGVFEQQTAKLRRQLIILLLLGVYRSEQELPVELTELFTHPKFVALSVWGNNVTAEEIEACSDVRWRFFAVPILRQNRIGVLANIEEDENMSDLISVLGKKLGGKATIFSGEVVDISGISASFIHSTSSTAMLELEIESNVLLSRECQELFQAVRVGDREVAMARAGEFSAMLLRKQLPLMELRRIHMNLLGKLRNLAVELNCFVSEENAAALMTSLSAEDFSAHLAECIADLCESGTAREEQPLQTAEVLQYIDEHICESDLSLSLIEDTFGMSRKRITSLVRNMTGLGFREYVIYQRIERAKLLLLNTNLPISEVALMCGYESASYFIKSFRNLTGRTPGQFQKDIDSVVKCEKDVELPTE